LRSLQELLGFMPGKLSVYKRAFIHKSAAKEIKKGFKDSNERLEFLGDAVLDMVISKYLYKKYPFRDEGFLTKMRSKLVNRERLNDLAMKIDLDKYVQVFSNSKIKNTSVYGNALEALIGAIYVDLGYKKATIFIVNKLIKEHINMQDLESYESDYKSKIFEYAQQYKKSLEFNMTEKISGNNGLKTYVAEITLDHVVLANGEGPSKKKAQQEAAQIAYKKIVSAG